MNQSCTHAGFRSRGNLHLCRMPSVAAAWPRSWRSLEAWRSLRGVCWQLFLTSDFLSSTVRHHLLRLTQQPPLVAICECRKKLEEPSSLLPIGVLDEGRDEFAQFVLSLTNEERWRRLQQQRKPYKLRTAGRGCLPLFSWLLKPPPDGAVLDSNLASQCGHGLVPRRIEASRPSFGPEALLVHRWRSATDHGGSVLGSGRRISCVYAEIP